MNWSIVYLASVQNWLDALDNQQLKSIAKELRLLELCGNTLKLPHSRSLGNQLFELRERKYGFRIYYTFDKNKVIILSTTRPQAAKFVSLLFSPARETRADGDQRGELRRFSPLVTPSVFVSATLQSFQYQMQEIK